MWDICLLVVVRESRDFSAMHATWHFQIIVAIFGPDPSCFETVSDLLSFSFRLKIQDQPPAAVAAARAENRRIIPFPISGLREHHLSGAFN
jgi:hypothetical protein